MAAGGTIFAADSVVGGFRAGGSFDPAASVAETCESIAVLVRLIGREGFERALVELAHDRFGADYLHIFELADGRPRIIASVGHDGTAAAHEHAELYVRRELWRNDELMRQADGDCSIAPSVYYMQTRTLSAGALRTYRIQMGLDDRLMAVARSPERKIGFSLVRASQSDCGSLSDDSFALFVQLVLPAIEKHVEIVSERSSVGESLRSRAAIEAKLRSLNGQLTRREITVGTGILYGDSAREIADNLGLSPETVITHRKRLYDRLNVASCRELLLLYLRS